MNLYSISDKWLWDPWIIKYKTFYHLFYLQAPKSKNPDSRHNLSSIGHALSRDLKKWKELPPAVIPSSQNKWDNLTIWTGSTFIHKNKFYLFYTGRNKNKKHFWEQKIGLAISSNLIDWNKYPRNPLLTADKKYYSTHDQRNKLGNIGAWRDPYIFYDKKNKKFYMLICAREKKHGKEFNACIGMAESSNLINWKTLPPILSPHHIYDEMELPQLITYNKVYYLFFNTKAKNCHPQLKSKLTGLYCYFSLDLHGPYKPVNGDGVVFSQGESIYGIRIFKQNKNKLLAVGSMEKDISGKYLGTLSPFIKIEITGKNTIKSNITN